LWPRSRQC